MSKVLAEYRNRYEVQVALTLTTLTGEDVPGRYEFFAAFDNEIDAADAAEGAAKHNRWVRVVDTEEVH